MFLLCYYNVVMLNVPMLPRPWLPSSIDADQYFQYSFRQKFEMNAPMYLDQKPLLYSPDL